MCSVKIFPFVFVVLYVCLDLMHVLKELPFDFVKLFSFFLFLLTVGNIGWAVDYL